MLQNRPAGQLSLSGSERSGDISFTGDPKLVTKIAKEAINGSDFSNVKTWAKKMGGAGWFDKVLNSVNDNEAKYEALAALVVAGIFKPICVLAMPGAEKEDKQMSATKNAVSAGIGFVISNLILGPFSAATNKITKSFDTSNPTKFIKDADYVKALTNDELVSYTTRGGKVKQYKSTLGDAFKSAYKKTPDMGVSPLKATLTIALTPYVLNLLFGKKNKKDKENNSLSPENMTVMNQIKLLKNNKENQKAIPLSDTETVAAPAGQLKPAGSERKLNEQNNGYKQPANSPSFTGSYNLAEQTRNEPSFSGNKVSQVIQIAQDGVKKKGILDPYNDFLSKPLSNLMGKFAKTNASKKYVQTFAKFDKPTARLSDLASISITGFYVYNTAKSEKMDEERKLPLMINNVMVTAASSTAAFLIDKYTDKPMENLLRGYLKKHDAAIYDQANSDIKSTLNNMLKLVKEGKKPDPVDVERLTRHSDELLKGGVENMSENFKDAVKALKNDSTIKEAVKSNIISEGDIARMAASGYEKIASGKFKNITKAKSLTVFTFTVRFLVTVLMTPVVGKVVDLVNKKLGRGKYKNGGETAQKQDNSTFGLKDFQELTK